MPDKVIPLDHPGRKLIIRQPETRKTRRGDRSFWVCLLDEAEHRENNEQPFEFCCVPADQTPEEIARSIRSPLYHFVSSSWLDESWEKEIGPQIAAFIKEARRQI